MEKTPESPISPEKDTSPSEKDMSQSVSGVLEIMGSPKGSIKSRRSDKRSITPKSPERVLLPAHMARASVIPIKSFTSGLADVPVYDKEDYNVIDSISQDGQDAEMFNWKSIIEDRLDRDSWTGGMGVYGIKAPGKPPRTSELTDAKARSVSTTDRGWSSLEGPEIPPQSKSSQASDLTEVKSWMSYPETYVSETELFAKQDYCKSYLERQNERTKRVALKLLDITESLAPAKYVLPTYRCTKHTVPVSMHTFKLNRIRLHEIMKCVDPKGFVLLKGGDPVNQYNTNVTYTFRQEPFFHWAFGVRHPSFWGGLCLRSGKSFLFIPTTSIMHQDWFEEKTMFDDVKKLYGVSTVMFEDEIQDVLTKCRSAKLFLLSGTNTDSGIKLKPPTLPFKTEVPMDTTSLYPAMCELRVVKNDYEIELIRQACTVSSDAHKYVMHSMVGMLGYFEYQAESLFLHYCLYMGGCRTTAYSCVCGSDADSASLHGKYAPNDKIVNSGDLCLFDMGASYYGYASDIACTFPANGKFTEHQKILYNCVLNGRNRALEIIRPGIGWDQVHLEVLKAMFVEMKKEAFLFGNVDEMIQEELGAVFMPHGVGHLLGIDVHDVGGYGPSTPSRPTRRSLKGLKTNRVLQKDMVITVQPGCYFIDKLLEEADENDSLAKFINFEKINHYRNVGGVRIEDVVLVTEFSCELLSEVPRTVEEIEAWMSSEPLEEDFDANLGNETLPCLCAKLPPNMAQLRDVPSRIIRGICGCNLKHQSSSSDILIHDDSAPALRDSVSEIFEPESFLPLEPAEEIDEQSEVKTDEEVEESLKFWKSKITKFFSDTSSSSSSNEHKLSYAKPKATQMKNSVDEEEDAYLHTFEMPPKAAPPTRPVPTSASLPQSQNEPRKNTHVSKTPATQAGEDNFQF